MITLKNHPIRVVLDKGYFDLTVETSSQISRASGKIKKAKGMEMFHWLRENVGDFDPKKETLTDFIRQRF